jgi:glycoside/pentoside/hexuronide:cation symporter, GPH family
MVGTALWIATMIIQFWIGPGDLVLLYILIAVRGTMASVAYLLPQSMLADTVRLDELRSGKRREGLFYALFLSLIKLAMALTQSASSALLGYVGYRPPDSIGPGMPDQQPVAVLWTLRILTSAAPAGLLFLAIACAAAYPMIFHQAETGVQLLLDHTSSESESSESDSDTTQP